MGGCCNGWTADERGDDGWGFLVKRERVVLRSAPGLIKVVELALKRSAFQPPGLEFSKTTPDIAPPASRLDEQDSTGLSVLGYGRIHAHKECKMPKSVCLIPVMYSVIT